LLCLSVCLFVSTKSVSCAWLIEAGTVIGAPCPLAVYSIECTEDIFPFANIEYDAEYLCCLLTLQKRGSVKLHPPPFFLNNSGSRGNFEMRFALFLGTLNPQTLVVHASDISKRIPCGNL